MSELYISSLARAVEGGKPPEKNFKFELSVERLVVEGHELGARQLNAELKDDLRLDLSLHDKGLGLSVFQRKDDEETYFTLNGIKIAAIPVNITSSNEGEHIFMVLQTRPVATTSTTFTKMKLSVVNGPELHREGVPLSFCDSDVSFKYTQFRGLKESFRSARRLPANFFTGFLEVTFRNPVDFDDAFREACRWAHLASFIRSGDVGLGFGVLIDLNGTIVGEVLEANRSDPTSGARNFYDLVVQNDLPALYGGFFEVSRTDAELIRVINRVIQFYRSSSAIRPSSLDMAIVAAGAGLEAAVPFILKRYGGWDNDLLSSRAKFSSKLRAAYTAMGVQDDFLLPHPVLEGLSKDKNGIDGFSIISLVRNRIAHPEEKFRLEGIGYYSVWNMQMWLLEVIIFYFLGYRGQMADRRVVSGFQKLGGEVPLRPIR
ncbi:MAG: hypothetical protein AAF366_07250 [Pseudomonadota bacterium]